MKLRKSCDPRLPTPMNPRRSLPFGPGAAGEAAANPKLNAVAAVEDRARKSRREVFFRFMFFSQCFEVICSFPTVTINVRNWIGNNYIPHHDWWETQKLSNRALKIKDLLMFA
jgi:hypothetical protein